MTTNYQSALCKLDIAIRKFLDVTDGYLNMKIGYCEFMEARNNYDSAIAEYDMAISAESEISGS